MKHCMPVPVGGEQAFGGSKQCSHTVAFDGTSFENEVKTVYISGIQLTWPHAGTDWAYMLKEVQECFVNIAKEIAKRELLLIVTPEPEEVKKQIVATVNMDNVRFLKCETNDTWARDHGAITMIDTGNPSLLDFTFNGWRRFRWNLLRERSQDSLYTGLSALRLLQPVR